MICSLQVEVTAKNVEELTTELSDLVGDTIEEDQNTKNLEVLTKILSFIADLQANGTTITEQVSTFSLSHQVFMSN